MISAQAGPVPGWRIWLSGIRPKTLVAGTAPVLVGAAAAWATGGFRPLAALLALIGALCLQAGANLANDAGDGAAGVDAERVGPPRLVQSRLASPEQVWRAALVSFALATIAGAGLAAIAGWPVVIIGLCALGAAAGYTVGPAPLSRLGLGEAAAFAFFGPVATLGTFGVATGRWDALPWPLGLPTGLLAAGLMLANNLRDRHSDEAAGKRTLVVRLGAGAARWLYRACLAGALLVPVASGLAGGHLGLAIAGVAAAPWTARALAAVRADRDGSALAPALGRMVDLLAVSALALAAGLLVPPLP